MAGPQLSDEKEEPQIGENAPQVINRLQSTAEDGNGNNKS